MTKLPLLTLSLLTLLLVTVYSSAETKLQPAQPDDLWQTTNSSIEVAGDVYRWHLQPGQSAELAIRADHPPLSQLRYYDYLTFELRLASGEVSGMTFDALGHVSGPRQYKVHNWQVAILTTDKEVWLRRCFELARPNWFPWDNPDGQGTDAFFRFSAIGLSPTTVVELRGLNLSRALVRLKPDFLPPITWPVLSRDDDGNAVYTLQHHVYNQANRPVDIAVAVTSPQDKFAIEVTPEKAENIKNGKFATFTITATMSKADEEAAPALYAEPLGLRFWPEHAPETAVTWQGQLVRPLGEDVRRQVILKADDVALLREKLTTDETLRSLIKPEQAIKGADTFVTKELLRIPTGHLHVSNNWVGPWRPGERMPEAINTETGETQFDTAIAARTWKEYMSLRGQAMEHLADAYLFTGDETYARKAIELFELYAQQYTELGWDDLFSPRWSTGEVILSSTRVAMSSTYGTNWYFKGHCRLLSVIADSPSWDAETRQRVYLGFVLPYATELMKFDGGISNMTDITNHNILLLGLAFRDAGLVRWALYSDPGLLRRLEDIAPDGFSSEGRPLNYHHAAMGEYLPALSFLSHSQLPLDFPKERLAAAIRMPFQRANLTGFVPNTGDSGRGYKVMRRREADWLVGMLPDQQWLFDLGSLSTVQARLHAYRTGRQPDPQAWQALIETDPRLFEHAGFAILRSGETPETQIMATLDFGRNPMHAHLDRNTISLSAFGHLFSQGPGSLYNVGSGGMTRNKDPKLESFITSGSLSQNVVMVDQRNQDPAVGELVRWEPAGERQVAVAKVPAIRPGVMHTRALVLEDGIVIMLDHLESDAVHTYDFVYHNFGQLSLGEGWSAQPVSEPLGKTANYENLIEPQRLSGDGPIQLDWEVAEGVHLALWQVSTGDAYTATTALNNQQTRVIPAPTPSLLQRTEGKTATFLTVLEPYRETPRVSGIEAVGDDGVKVLRADGKPIIVRLAELAR